MVTVVICSYFEEEHVERIRAVDELAGGSHRSPQMAPLERR
jgi:hypothetical protein